MTPAEMDEVVATARTALAKGALTLSTEFAGRLARALLAAVREVERVDSVAAEMILTERARAVAAEQRAERAEAAVAALTTGAQRVLTDERARVVEAIAASFDVEAENLRGAIVGLEQHGDRQTSERHEHSAWWCRTSARRLRTTNWAAPEEESNG